MLLADLGLAPVDHLLLAFTRGRSPAATELCRAARRAGVTVTLLGLKRWDPRAFRRRLEAAAATWPSAAPRRAVLIADEAVDEREVREPGGFRIVQLGADGGEPAGALRARAERTMRELAGERLTVRSRDGAAALTLVRRRPPRWDGQPAQPWQSSLLVLPAGHLESAVESADGLFVADGALRVNRLCNADVRLDRAPVRLAVHDSMVTGIEGADSPVADFLRRAVLVHRADRVTAVRVGLGGAPAGFSPRNGAAVNDCQVGVAIRLAVDPGRAFSPASADLWIDLSAAGATVAP